MSCAHNVTLLQVRFGQIVRLHFRNLKNGSMLLEESNNISNRSSYKVLIDFVKLRPCVCSSMFLKQTKGTIGVYIVSCALLVPNLNDF